jgi:hypothetical protein
MASTVVDVSVVDTNHKRTRGKLVDPKLIRPIQREERTW